MSLEIQILSSLLLTSANKMTNFFLQVKCFSELFFSEITLEGGGLYTSAAYTRVRLIHESLRYFKIKIHSGQS